MELLLYQQTTTPSLDFVTQLSMEPLPSFCIDDLGFKTPPAIQLDFMTPNKYMPRAFSFRSNTILVMQLSKNTLKFSFCGIFSTNHVAIDPPNPK